MGNVNLSSWVILTELRRPSFTTQISDLEGHKHHNLTHPPKHFLKSCTVLYNYLMVQDEDIMPIYALNNTKLCIFLRKSLGLPVSNVKD